MIYVSIISALLAVASAECPNACSSHGKCTAYDMCLCYRNWMSNDCSERVCQFGLAHVDTPKGDLDASSGEPDGPDKIVAIKSEMYPYGTTEQFPAMTDSANTELSETAHYYMECSNKGICDRSSGVCECFPGYEGSACQRASCPTTGGATCSGHGTCETIKQIAKRDFDNIYELWDEKSTMGCVCDAGYYGPDCSMRRCKYGADPLYYDDNANIRYSTWNVIFGAGTVDTLDGFFSIVFYDYFGEDWETDPIAHDADCDDIIKALEGLDNDVIPTGSVRCQMYASGGDGWDLPAFFGESFGTDMKPLKKFALSFPQNPGYLKEIKINKYLDGTRPTLYTATETDSTLQIFVYPDGFTGEDFDVVPDECENVIVTFSTNTDGRHYLSFTSTGEQVPLLKRCLGDADNDPSYSSSVNDVYQWDFGSVINPHLVKFIPKNPLTGVKLCAGTGPCDDTAPQGFYAPLIFDDTASRFYIYINLRSELVGSREFRVFTTTGYLKMVSVGADVASAQRAGLTTTWSSQLSNVLYTTYRGDTYVDALEVASANALNVQSLDLDTYGSWAGNVDCETYKDRKNGDDCLQKGDRVMFFSSQGLSTSDTKNPRFHNMYTVQKISRGPIMPNDRSLTSKTCGAADLSDIGDGVCDSAYNNLECGFDGGDCCVETCVGTCNAASMECVAPSFNRIVLDTHTNFYAQMPPEGSSTPVNDVHFRAYKFYPPTKPVRYVDECSGRGLCNSADGICECFAGYTYDDCSVQNSAAK
jgi:hypothetical protein